MLLSFTKEVLGFRISGVHPFFPRRLRLQTKSQGAEEHETSACKVFDVLHAKIC